MNSVEKADYMRDITADRDFILSYFEYEKYQERERNHDDGDTPTEELAPKKKPEKEEHIEYANTADKSLRIPREKSMEGVLARVSEKQKNEQTKNREKTQESGQQTLSASVSQKEPAGGRLLCVYQDHVVWSTKPSTILE